MTVQKINQILSNLYSAHNFLIRDKNLDDKEMRFFQSIDAEMKEAYLHGYWDELVSFLRSMLNAAFKTNPYLERAVLTGITRISKESIFSDLNNLKVITTTSENLKKTSENTALPSAGKTYVSEKK